MRSSSVSAFLFIVMTSYPAFADGKDMSGAELKNLLEDGKTLQLGGEGQGYTGTLVIAPDGTAEGSAKPESGGSILINGKWRIEGNKFCRTWEKLDGGKEVCERWHLVAPNKVEVYQGDKMAGVNSW